MCRTLTFIDKTPNTYIPHYHISYQEPNYILTFLDQKTHKIKNAIILILERCPQKKISSVLAECLTYGRKL